MSSLILHIVASNIVKLKYNLSDEFLAGSIMPDIIKRLIGDKPLTHYQRFENAKSKDNIIYKKSIIEYDKFIMENKNKMNSPIKLGYAAHLVEDSIWFEKFIPRYADYADYEKKLVRFTSDNAIHTDEEFAKRIYHDYALVDGQILKEYNLDIDKIRERILSYYSGEPKELVKKELIKYPVKENDSLQILNYKDAEEYVDVSSKQVEKILEKYLNKLSKNEE